MDTSLENQATRITDLSAQLYVQLQRLTASIGLFRSYYSMAGFYSKHFYTASHVHQRQEKYTAEQWLSDFFANKTGLIPSFLDMNQCVPPSPDAAAKMLASFLAGLEAMPQLTPKDGGEAIGLFEALRIDIEQAHASRKLRGTSPIILTPTQKAIGARLVQDIDEHYQATLSTMQALHAAHSAK